MAVKSAMMTTAYDLSGTTAGTKDSDPFNQGAGHVDPTKFLNPGVVFDSDQDDWYSYIAGQGASVPASAGDVEPTDASDLNVASLAIGDLVARQVVTRELTNVSGAAESYQAKYTGSEAISVTFDQDVYNIPAGGTVPVKITVTAKSGFGSYAKGFVTFTGKSHVARIPVAVRPVQARVPAEVTAKVSVGSLSIGGTSGFTGTLGTQVAGLIGVKPESSSVATGAREHIVTVPKGTDYVRFDVDAVNNSDDLDMVVYQIKGGQRVEVGVSATGAADERVSLEQPAAGRYVAVVEGFSLSTGSNGAYSFTGIALPAKPLTPPNLVLNPPAQPVTAGNPFTILASWKLSTARTYLGRVQYLQNGTPTGVFTVVTLTSG
ncbi:MAG: hypothetical protein LH624_19215, partial [Cryobacterium sp.]|nr:hypothetical protein [Cryobacterium sp.]